MKSYTYYVIDSNEKSSGLPDGAPSPISQTFKNPVNSGDYVCWYDKGKTLSGSISGVVKRVRHYPDYSILDVEPDKLIESDHLPEKKSESGNRKFETLRPKFTYDTQQPDEKIF